MMGYALHGGARRPRRVKEKADRLLKSQPAHFRTQGQKMVVLHPIQSVRVGEAQQRGR